MESCRPVVNRPRRLCTFSSEGGERNLVVAIRFAETKPVLQAVVELKAPYVVNSYLFNTLSSMQKNPDGHLGRSRGSRRQVRFAKTWLLGEPMRRYFVSQNSRVGAWRTIGFVFSNRRRAASHRVQFI